MLNINYYFAAAANADRFPMIIEETYGKNKQMTLKDYQGIKDLAKRCETHQVPS